MFTVGTPFVSVYELAKQNAFTCEAVLSAIL